VIVARFRFSRKSGFKTRVFSRLFAWQPMPSSHCAFCRAFQARVDEIDAKFEAPSACLSRTSSEPRPETASGTMAAAGGIHALTYLEKYVESTYLSAVTPA
jgi:hypothetical protein